MTVRDLEGRVVAAAGVAAARAHRAGAGASCARARSSPGRARTGSWPRPRGTRPASSAGTSSCRRPGTWAMPGLWRPGLGVGLVLLIVALAAAPLARRISKPVERLTEAARRLGAGDLGYRVPLDSRDARHGRRPVGRPSAWRRRTDELGDLTRAFNDMAGAGGAPGARPAGAPRQRLPRAALAAGPHPGGARPPAAGGRHRGAAPGRRDRPRPSWTG